MKGLGVSSGLEDLVGSVLRPLYLRLLGANIHRHAAVYSMEVGDPEVLRVGEGVVLDDGAVLCHTALDKGEAGQTMALRLGPIWVRGRWTGGVRGGNDGRGGGRRGRDNGRCVAAAALCRNRGGENDLRRGAGSRGGRGR